MVRAHGRVTSRRSRCVSSRWHKARKMGEADSSKQTDRQCGQSDHERSSGRATERECAGWTYTRRAHTPLQDSLPPGFCILRFHRRTLPQHNTVPGGRVGPSRITPSSGTRRYGCFGHDTVCHTRDSERCLRVHERIPKPNTATTKHSNNKTQRQQNTATQHEAEA